MTQAQISETIRLRGQNMGYGAIAKALGISSNTVAAYCKRHGLAGKRATGSLCKCCGKPIEQPKGKRHKTFCSGKCRQKWWKEHSVAASGHVHTATCACCGKAFIVYSTATRKYCSVACYREGRFGHRD